MCGSTEMTGAATGPATAASSASIEAPPTMARCGLSAAWGDTTRPAPLRPPRLRSPSSPHYATVCTTLRNCALGVFRAPPGIAAAGRARRGPWCGWRGALALCAALVLTPPGATLRTVHT